MTDIKELPPTDDLRPIQLVYSNESKGKSHLRLAGAVRRTVGIRLVDGPERDDGLVSIGLNRSESIDQDKTMVTIQELTDPKHLPMLQPLLASQPRLRLALADMIEYFRDRDYVVSISVETDEAYGGPPIIVAISTSLDFEQTEAERREYWTSRAPAGLVSSVLLDMYR